MKRNFGLNFPADLEIIMFWRLLLFAVYLQ